MSLKKQFLKSKPLCKVSFKVNQKDAKGAKSIQILGDFNNWDTATAPMRSLKNGSFSQTVNLESGKDYQFRYLLDGDLWSNEKEADASISNTFNSLNDVVTT